MPYIYDIFKESNVTNNFGEKYPDVCSGVINKFKYSETPYSRIISQMEIDRFDLLVYYYYGNTDYTDLVLWLNGKGHKSELKPGDKIILPSLKDIKNFYYENR